MSELPRPQRKTTRQGRLSAALRDNLKRRKAQEKAREKGRAEAGAVAEATVDRPGGSHDSAGIGADKRKR